MLRIWTAPSSFFPKHEMSMVPSGEKPRWDRSPVDGVWSGGEFVCWKMTLRVLGNLGRYIWLIFDVGGVKGRADK